jgi:hypothetical protein|tara:strand:- start:15 stop:299 length:285 start_codon:yes stop_codon:yes gene_type:complete
MNPDNQIIEDFKFGCLITLIFAPVLFVAISFGGYAPADECANAVKNGMNYTRKQMLVNAEPTYNNIRAWCVVNIEQWESKLDEARDYQTADYQY